MTKQFDSTTPVNNPPWNLLNTPEERYRNDPVFRGAVDAMQYQLEHANFTPSELRQAAIMACILYERRHIDPTITDCKAIGYLRSLEGLMAGGEVMP